MVQNQSLSGLLSCSGIILNYLELCVITSAGAVGEKYYQIRTVVLFTCVGINDYRRFRTTENHVQTVY